MEVKVAATNTCWSLARAMCLTAPGSVRSSSASCVSLRRPIQTLPLTLTRGKNGVTTRESGAAAVKWALERRAVRKGHDEKKRKDADDDRQLPRRRRPKGYWKDSANVAREVIKVAEKLGRPSEMPRVDDLRIAGWSTLVSAIKMHGGRARFAARLGLTLPLWGRADVSSHNRVSERVKTCDSAMRRDCNDLGAGNHIASMASGDANDGFAVQGGQGSSSRRRRPHGYWKSMVNVEAEIERVVGSRSEDSGLGVARMPLARELNDLREFALHKAICAHGGYRKVAAVLGLRRASRGVFGKGRSPSPAENENGIGDHDPITYHREPLCAADMGATTRRSCSRKPREHWKLIENVDLALRSLAKARNLPHGTMPTGADLLAWHDPSLRHAVNSHGGIRVVAGKLGLSLASHPRRAPRGGWLDFTLVADRLKAALVDIRALSLGENRKGVPGEGDGGSTEGWGSRRMKKTVGNGGKGFKDDGNACGAAGSEHRRGSSDDFSPPVTRCISDVQKLLRMPTRVELIDAGYGRLVGAIERYHGGIEGALARMGYESPTDVGGERQSSAMTLPVGYWQRTSNFHAHLRGIALAAGQPMTMPNRALMLSLGENSAIKSVQRNGGFARVAADAGLTYSRKPPGYWVNFVALETEIIRLLDSFEWPRGSMPAAREFRKRGHGRVVQAAYRYHGGLFAVARRMGLTIDRRKSSKADDE